MILLELAIVGLALIGHTGIWVTFVNRLHATTLSKTAINTVNVIGLGTLCSLPLVYAGLLLSHGLAWTVATGGSPAWQAARWYLWACAPVGVIATYIWARREHWPVHVPALRSEKSVSLDVAERLGATPLERGWFSIVAQLPGNECFQLEINEKELELPRLSPSLDGLTIAHLSDLHFADRIKQHFFEEVVRATNELDCDLVLITGDLMDKARCIDWIPDTLGQLTSRLGIYAIMGNHDVRLKHELPRLRMALAASGVQYLGSRWTRIQLAESAILVAGNELPWFRPAADLSDSPSTTAEPDMLRILMAHSPDQYPWARMHDFDLMLAGHNHGGQVCLPVVGPLFSPSRFGVRYASGTFHEPPTVLHVSRGISALDPLRYNCPPEVTKLILRSPVRGEPQTTAETLASVALSAGR